MTFTKSLPDAPAGFFRAEVAGLAWLASAGVGCARVVGVRSVSEDSITLERLQQVPPTKRAAERFGQALARTHATGAAAFGQGPDGWSGDGFIGQQPLSLRPTATWGAFYAEQRLLPYARSARGRGRLSESGMRAVERVCARLGQNEWDDGGPPARIHGDLWSGNVLFTPSGVVLIDPAAHGGHPLTDLAMLHLFGAPQLEAITSAYVEAASCLAGWQELIGLHQLHPLLVHAASHGAAYGREAASVASRYA